MNRRNRIFLGVLLLFALGVGSLLYTVAAGLDTRYRESAEETLVDTAYLLAAWIETDTSNTLIDDTRLSRVFQNVYRRTFTAHIYAITKHHVDLRAYVTDVNGYVVFDSWNKDEGEDFRAWHDVSMALSGQYGARTTRNDPADPDSAVMYVAAPIYDEQNNIVGTVSVGKAVASQHDLVATARQKLLWVGIITLVAFLAMLVVISIWLASPFQLTHDLIQVLKQEKITHPARVLRRFKIILKNAFFDMRDTMAGRSYTEEYIQALTHELKSPLTAIRGAAELLREPMPEAQRARFSENISEQVNRLQDLADRLLELASLEKRHTLDDPHTLKLDDLARDIVEALETSAKGREISLLLNTEEDVPVLGDEFLLQRAISNLIANALDFASAGSEIQISVKRVDKQGVLEVRDHGPGIPEYALDRVFEKFYSLRRPDSGQKSTGLGLPFVREIAHLHDGEAVLANHPDGGAVATIILPLRTDGV